MEPNPSGSPAISRVEPAGGGHALGWAASQLAEGGQAGAVAGDNQPSVARGGPGRAKPGPEPAVSELSAAQAGGFRQGERDGARPEASEESSAGAVVDRPLTPSVSQAEQAVLSPLPSTMAVDLGAHGETGHARGSYDGLSAEAAAPPSTPLSGPVDKQNRLLQAQMSAVHGRRLGASRSGRRAGGAEADSRDGVSGAPQPMDDQDVEGETADAADVLGPGDAERDRPAESAPASRRRSLPMDAQILQETSAANDRRLSDAQYAGRDLAMDEAQQAGTDVTSRRYAAPDNDEQGSRVAVRRESPRGVDGEMRGATPPGAGLAPKEEAPEPAPAGAGEVEGGSICSLPSAQATIIVGRSTSIITTAAAGGMGGRDFPVALRCARQA